MKRFNLLFLLLFLLRTLVCFALPIMFFVTLSREHHFGWHAELLLIGCLIWPQLPRLKGWIRTRDRSQ